MKRASPAMSQRGDPQRLRFVLVQGVYGSSRLCVLPESTRPSWVVMVIETIEKPSNN